MSRKRNVLGAFLSACEKEARRAAREQERQYRIEQKEALRQEKQLAKIKQFEQDKQVALKNTTKAICVEAMIPDVKYLSLKNEKAPYLKDVEIFSDVINYLKEGKRIKALEYYVNNSNCEYNEIVEIIKYLEDNLNEIIKNHKYCKDNDEIGKYEFQSLQNLIQTSQLEDDNKISIELRCKPIHEVEIISSKNVSVIQNKSQTVIKKFAKIWMNVFTEYHEQRENKIISQINNEINNILIYGVNEDAFCWDKLKDYSPFISDLPIVNKPATPNYKDTEHVKNIIQLNENKSFDEKTFEKNWYEKMLSTVLLKSISDYLFNERKKNARDEFTRKTNEIIETNKKELKNIIKYNEDCKKAYDEKMKSYNKYCQDFADEEKIYYTNQKKNNEDIDKLIEKFNNKDIEIVEDYFEYILEQSIYPVLFNKNIAIEYNYTNGILIVNYVLPNIEDIYNIKNIKRNGNKDDYKINYITEKQHRALYDKVIYQICFRSIHEIIKSDSNNYIKSVVFNGYSNCIDKKDGQLKMACILSLQVSKTDFEMLNLENIAPKDCFKALKGVAAVELASLTPIKPILSLNKDDDRFIDAYEVMDKIEDGYNLATMDWQDFENLIREIFEQEFSSNGGEVKVTQSSRDGGVDAIAFDPDPIRGGKIVIQAKRYTNVVGVSAVRDLYGTVMNEGAIKGILVTTADYGADSYDFAKDKPLTLLNGGHLLHLLEKHGHKARINLQEAKDYFKKQITK